MDRRTEHGHHGQSEEHRLLHHIIHLLETIVTTNAQHAQDLLDLKNQVSKSKAEILKRISDLEAAQGANTSPEVDAAMEALKAEVQGVDDINPDVPTP